MFIWFLINVLCFPSRWLTFSYQRYISGTCHHWGRTVEQAGHWAALGGARGIRTWHSPGASGAWLARHYWVSVGVGTILQVSFIEYLNGGNCSHRMFRLCTTPWFLITIVILFRATIIYITFTGAWKAYVTAIDISFTYAWSGLCNLIIIALLTIICCWHVWPRTSEWVWIWSPFKGLAPRTYCQAHTLSPWY